MQGGDLRAGVDQDPLETCIDTIAITKRSPMPPRAQEAAGVAVLEPEAPTPGPSPWVKNHPGVCLDIVDAGDRSQRIGDRDVDPLPARATEEDCHPAVGVRVHLDGEWPGQGPTGRRLSQLVEGLDGTWTTDLGSRTEHPAGSRHDRHEEGGSERCHADVLRCAATDRRVGLRRRTRTGSRRHPRTGTARRPGHPSARCSCR